jgi:hypothetical protein
VPDDLGRIDDRSSVLTGRLLRITFASRNDHHWMTRGVKNESGWRGMLQQKQERKPMVLP